MFIFGTRPEAIKLAPLLHELGTRSFDVQICVTAQHRQMLDQILTAFQLKPAYDLDIMTPGQTLFQSTSRILAGLEAVFDDARPDMVIVQGDTTSTFCGALAAFYRHIPLAHVEAGLRTNDLRQPFPEELNRVLTSRMTTLHFAATEWAASNLHREGFQEKTIFVTGNTGIDAVLYVRDQLEAGGLKASWSGPIDADKKLIVVTAHRRESFGPGFDRICSALANIARREDVQLVYPVHPNPNVQNAVDKHLRGLSNVLLLPPLDYVDFVDLMRRAYLLITDSGGVQEEGPSLGKPILVLREKTERPEAVEAGTVLLVGTDEDRIVRETFRLLDDSLAYEGMACRHNPYGDGQASRRIAAAIEDYFTGAD